MAEPQEQDFSKLPLEEKLTHKVWKARVQGYEEAAKLFRRLDDEKSSEYSKLSGMVKKFVVDSNVIAQEKALEATLAFVECAAPTISGRICGDVIPGVVTKCLNARPKTKEAGINVCLMFVEVEQQAVVQEEITKGLTNKQPKIVAGCILVLRTALQEFGAKVVNVKQLLKAMPPMFEHSDKNVRTEAKSLAVELCRWTGAVVLKPTLEKNLKPVQMKELEEEWSKLPGEPAVPTRFLRSQQQAAVAVGGGGEEVGGGGESGDVGGGATAEAIDPLEFVDPVDLLSQMPKDFFEKLADPKWKERKEALEALLPLAQSPKLVTGEYGELVKALKKVITKDSNVLVVALAGNVVTGLAKGLRKHYQPYAAVTMAGIYEKFKEKKQNVVTSLRDAADAVYNTTSLGNIQDETVEALNSKNPSVKAETLLFLARCFQQCTPAMLPKPFLKAFCPVIVQRLDDTTPQVREAACESIATLLKVVGDRPMNAYLENVDKTKMAKIQEQREKIEIKIRTGVITSPVSKPTPAVVAAKTVDSSLVDESRQPVKKKPVLSSQKKVAQKAEGEGEKGGDTSGDSGMLLLMDDEPAKPVKKKPVLPSQRRAKKEEEEEQGESEVTPAPAEEKPKQPAASAAPKKKPPASGGGGAKAARGKGKGKGKGGAGKLDEPSEKPEPSFAPEEIDEKAGEVLPPGLLDQLADPKWKDRLGACERFQEFVDGLPGEEMQSHLFVRVLARKPGWKDSNFQVMKAKFAIVATLAQRAATFGKRSTGCVLPALVDKFSDLKVKPQSCETLMLIAERMTLNYVSLQVMKSAFEHKSPKVQAEALEWLGQSLKEFGFLINVKPHIDYVKKAFGATNPAVRSSAINLVSVMHMFLGPQLRVFFEEEKAALLSQIDATCEKVAGESPPAPTRGPNVGGDEEEEEEGGGGGGGGGGAQAQVSLADLMPKVDISGQLKPELIKELGDKNWKIRGEALQKVQGIISAAKFIQPSLGELPGALKGRLGDSNKNLVMTTLNIVASLATAMGSSCSKYAKALIPGVLGTLADGKPHVRQTAIATLNAWFSETSLSLLIEQEYISNALATENPNLRTELLNWLEEKLPDAGKLPSEASMMVPPLLSCLEDRSGEVRKKAQAVLPLFMAQVGYDTMMRHISKLKPASKQAVKALLDKHRAAAPQQQAAPKTTTTKPPASGSGGPGSGKGGSGEKGEKRPPSEQASSGAPSGGGSTKKGTAKSSGSSAKGGKQKGGAEEVASAPLVLVPNGKEQRMKDEEKMKTLKWNFSLPRAEHIDQLKEQMQPCVSPALFSQLFHDDFKQHLAAIATLNKCVSGDAPHKDAAISCLDVLLRWITLRFFETNTTINLKCLEFLHALFRMLVKEGSFRMSDYEGNAFLPYLVQKVGDAKDAVRKGVRSLFRELCSFYPPTKLFTFVLDGLKSKNARQRTECLDELGVLIQNNGMVVCGPAPQKTLPLIAAQISDRDNAVRSAALNTLVVVYGNVGEGVFKFAAQLSEKEVSLLEERIRRSGKKPPSVPGPAPSELPPATGESTTAQAKKQETKAPGSSLKPSSSTEALPAPEQPQPQQEKQVSPPPPPAQPAKPQPPPVTGPFRIDMGKYAAPRVGSKFTNGTLKLQTVDTSIFREPTTATPKFAASRLLAYPPARVSVSPSRMASTSAAINYIISQITSSDTTTSSKALRQMEAIISNPTQRISLVPHIDQLLRAVLMQMRMNFTTPLAMANDPQSQQEVMDLGRKLTSCLVAVFSEPTLSVVSSQDSLIEVEHDVMTYLVDERLLKLEEVAQLIRSFNYLMLRVCENADKTALFGSLLQVLLKSVNADGSSTKLTEMTMKCLWKITRQLSQFLPSLNVDQLLREVHLFFQGYTKLVPAPTPDDTPYRTVKTILFHLTNIIGTEVLDHLTLIKDAKQSRVTQYVRKTLAKKRLSVEKGAEGAGSGGKVEESDGGRRGLSKSVSSGYKPSQPSPFASESLPPGASAQLADIFKKISAPQSTREGLLELYQFKQQHPGVDLGACQRGTTKFYQAYIERGLKSIECELSAAEGKGGAPLAGSTSDNALASDEYKERAKALETVRVREAAKLEKQSTAVPVPSAEPSTDESALRLPVPDENKPSLSQGRGQSQLRAPGGPRPGGGSLNLDDLRKRLDRLKGST